MSVLLGLLLAGCGAFGGANRPVLPTVNVGKFKAQSLHAAHSKFSRHHLVVQMAAGQKPPVAGVRVRPAIGDYQIHELPGKMTVDQAMEAYQQAPGVQAIEALELFPMEDETTTPVAPAMPALEVPTSPAVQPAVNDPLYFEQWSHEIVGVPDAWHLTRGRPEVVVAVLDTGVDYTHPDLAGQVINGPDFAEGKDDSRDMDYHGTHVAGVIAAKADNGIGIAGVAPGAKVLALKIFEPYYENGRYDGAHFNAFSLARAVQYAATVGGAKVINISAGIPDHEVVDTMLAFARGKGVVICVSAGNNASNAYTGQAKYMDGVLTVHATDSMDRLARFSNFGNTMGLSAPGTAIMSTVPTYPNPYTKEQRSPTGYERLQGTSMAAPMVAGLSALVVSALMESVDTEIMRSTGEMVQTGPADIPGTIVEDLVRSTCRDLGRPGRDEVYGAGRIDAGRAMAACIDKNWVKRTAREVLRNQKR